MRSRAIEGKRERLTEVNMNKKVSLFFGLCLCEFCRENFPVRELSMLQRPTAIMYSKCKCEYVCMDARNTPRGPQENISAFRARRDVL